MIGLVDRAGQVSLGKVISKLYRPAVTPLSDPASACCGSASGRCGSATADRLAQPVSAVPIKAAQAKTVTQRDLGKVALLRAATEQSGDRAMLFDLALGIIALGLQCRDGFHHMAPGNKPGADPPRASHAD
jgi:hypothetical protein